MSAFARGSTAVTFAQFTSAGVPVQVDGVTVDIIDPDGIVVVAGQAPTRNPSTGRYEYDYPLAVDAKLGDWIGRWTGTYLGTPATGDDEFTVLQAVDISFGETVRELITLAELETRLGAPVADPDQATAFIQDASALALQIINDPDTTDGWNPAESTVPRTVVPVIVAMVRRSLDNPHGFSSESQQGYSYRGASTAGVFATAAEAGQLRAAAGQGSPRAVDLTAGLPTPRRGYARTPWPQL